jgi:hypothetical protein
MCGEGMPGFYFKNDTIDHDCSKILDPVLHLLGLCQSINNYGYRYDSDGLPLIEDC